MERFFISSVSMLIVSISESNFCLFTKKTSSTFSPRVEIFAECIDIL